MNRTYTVTHLAERVWAIDETWVQCYLVEGDQEAVLFDCCASAEESFAQTVAELTDKPVRLVFSHGDSDHTGAQEFFGTPSLHPAEFDHYVAQGNAGREVEPLWDGEVIDIGGTSLDVILLPGHTPGSIALLDHEARRLYCGDTISDAWIRMFGPGRNLDALIDSLGMLEALVPDFDIIHSSHGSMELGSDWVRRTRVAAEKLRDGELVGRPDPDGLPFPRYSDDGVNLIYPPLPGAPDPRELQEVGVGTGA
jgi:glyoxylase-like metal-dependent hydrolase (beta-lactamase superfamily II)